MRNREFSRGICATIVLQFPRRGRLRVFCFWTQQLVGLRDAGIRCGVATGTKPYNSHCNREYVREVGIMRLFRCFPNSMQFWFALPLCDAVSFVPTVGVSMRGISKIIFKGARGVTGFIRDGSLIFVGRSAMIFNWAFSLPWPRCCVGHIRGPGHCLQGGGR